MSAIVAPVEAQSTRDALGGAWATSFTLWAVLLIPTLALSSYQDFGETYPNVLLAALAALLPCAAVAVLFLIVRFCRRNVRTIPLPLCLAFWAAVGVVHGVTDALLDSALYGADSHVLAQAIYWAAASLIWIPLATYGISQSSYRRRLLVSLQIDIRSDNSLRQSSLIELAELRSLIVNAIQDNIRPVLVEIEHSLENLRPALESARLTELGAQLADVSDETTRIIETTVGAQPVASKDGPIPITPLAAALDFDQSRPLLGGVLASVALLPLVVAVSFNQRSIDVNGIESASLILATVMVLLVAGLASQRFMRHRQRRTRIASALVAYLIAGVAAAVVAVVGPWQPANQQNLALALLLPIAVTLAAVTLSAGVGLGNANFEVVREIRDIEAGIAQLEEGLDTDRHEIRNQVSALTHGPLRGRLAACAMALNFHAAEISSSDPARTEHIITGVREHLADVLTELDSLG